MYEPVISGEVRGIKCATEIVVDEVLPGDWQAEGIEPVIGHEVLHLCYPVGAWIGNGGERARSVC